jgi:peptidyl-prolyl cis-trans isomerase SurA
MKKIINKKIFFYSSVWFLFFFLIIANASNVKIIAKIDNDIITNIDIRNEYSYLLALNKSLKDIQKEQVLDFAKQSIFREKIKKQEILKYYELNQKNEIIDMSIKNIYNNLGLNSEDEFIEYLKNLNLNFDKIYKKIEIETVWNQLVYQKYKDKLVINKENLKNKIKISPKKKESYYLHELVFDFKEKKEINAKYQTIIKSINDIGFEKTVIEYSISDTKNNLGLLGWVDKKALSEKIKSELTKINLGEMTRPIPIPGGILILKLSDKKVENVDIDMGLELEKLIKYETNNQLNSYSTIYFNKVKSQISINEY